MTIHTGARVNVMLRKTMAHITSHIYIYNNIVVVVVAIVVVVVAIVFFLECDILLGVKDLGVICDREGGRGSNRQYKKKCFTFLGLYLTLHVISDE